MKLMVQLIAAAALIMAAAGAAIAQDVNAKDKVGGTKLILAAHAPADTAPPYAAGGFTIPADIRMPVVELQFAGGYSAKFIIDTENGNSSITDTVAAILRIKPRPAVFPNGKPILTDEPMAQMVDITGFKIGDTVFNGTMLVADHRRMTPGADGIIGLNFMMSYWTMIDFKKQRLTIWNTPLDGAERSKLGFEGAADIPVVIDSDMQMSIHGRYNGARSEELLVLTSSSDSPTILPFSARFTRIIGFAGPVIDVKLGVSFIGKFVLDSGTSTSLITDAVADKLKLKSHPVRTSDGMPLIIMNEPARSVDVQMTIGDQNGGVQQLVVVKRKDLPFDLDGIIGCNFFNVFSTLIDFGNNTMKFWYNGSPTVVERSKLGFVDAIAVPTALGEPMALTVHARYNDSVEDDMVIDTGSVITQISQGVARQLKLHPIDSGDKERIFGGTEKVNSAIVSRLAIGNFVVNDLRVWYSAQGGSRVVKQCVGLDILSHYRILIDAPNHMIYLKSLEASKVRTSTTAAEAPRPLVGPKYMWKPLYKPGQSYTTRYVITTTTDRIKDNKPHKGTDTQRERYAVKAVQPDGAMTTSVVILDYVTEADGQSTEPVAIPNGKNSATLTFSPRGELTGGWEHSKTPELLREVMYFRDCVAPPQAVRVGESWHALVKSRAYAGKTIDETWTLESAAVKSGKTVLTLHVKAALTFKALPPEVVSVDGTFTVDQSSGQLESRHIVFGDVPLTWPTFPGEQAICTITVDEMPEGEQSTNAACAGR